MTTYLTNAFPLGACSRQHGPLSVKAYPQRDADHALATIEGEGLRLTPAIGHRDLAEIVRRDLRLPGSPYARATLSLKPGDSLIVAQYTGPRLRVGAVVLPPEAAILYWFVALEEDDDAS